MEMTRGVGERGRVGPSRRTHLVTTVSALLKCQKMNTEIKYKAWLQPLS